jgi:methionine-rich copper-binding protein CopC
MKTSLRAALAAAALLASPCVLARTALVASLPANGQVLDASPTEIRLTFNEHVDARGASVKLVSAKGQHWDCDRPHGDRADPATLAATVPVLRSGSYRARWTVVAPDGRKMHGDLQFSIK